MQETQSLVDFWQAEAQSGLAQIDSLKDMLSEGVAWSVTHADGNGHGNTEQESGRPQAPLQDTKGDSADAGVNESDTCTQCRIYKASIEQQAAQIADLDVQLRALVAEQLRTSQLSCQVGRAVLPALYSIESRLLQLHDG
eukprot:TRINITY_DN46312_c0_g1_i1.p1 TRINITY_DN46312_c0_g1~~TRINITY_DN46312_c0_g1_i1.p1  ORF type:complete len:140 (+),score=11.15 TRINITY_DN46312_c0_g1_i1:125-544(+)